MAFEFSPQPSPSTARHETLVRRQGQLATLADLAAEAVALQPDAHSAVSRCGVPGKVADSVGLELGRISHSYSLIYERARHLPVDAELIEARAELCRLLSYHMHMLRDAGDLAFSGRTDARTEPFRRELADGLGTFAATLVTVAAQLRDLASAATARLPDAWTASDEFQLDDVELGARESDIEEL